MAAEIIAVQTRYQPARPGWKQHRHITHVQTADGRILIREEVAGNILASIEEYFTLALGIEADVTVMPCPRCRRADYITTHPDQTKANNLLFLPPIWT